MATTTSAQSGMAAVYRYFSSTYASAAPGKPGGLSGFRADWARLSDSDKAQLRAGTENGTFTY